jgi:trigger factor
VLKAVADVCEVEFSSALVGEEIDRLLAQRSSRFGEGRVGLEAYLRSEGKTEDALREELKPLAVERVAHSLILAKVAEEEKIDVTDEEVDSEIESMRGNGGEWQKLFDSPAARSSIRQMLLTRKTMNRLAEIAEGDGGSEL